MSLNVDLPDLARVRMCTGEKELHNDTHKEDRGRICYFLHYPSSSFTNIKYTHVNKNMPICQLLTT